MSRIGNRILELPENVSLTIDGNKIIVKGPKGELSTEINPNITVKIEENKVEITRKNDNFKNFHGTANANIKNMIIGVTVGYQKKLEAVGVGYRFAIKGETLLVTAGYSRPIEVTVPNGIKIEVPSNTELLINGIDKQLVGEFTANVRKIRKPEPYKGKGIRYHNEQIIRKVGKKAA